MRSLITLIILLFTLNGLCQSVIPTPSSMTPKDGEFTLSPKVVVTANKDAAYALELFKTDLLKSIQENKTKQSHRTTIKFIKDGTLSSESYRLSITPTEINISASDKQGYIYAVQTLKQLAVINGNSTVFPCVEISDSPRVEWRSFLLDSGRQYHRVTTIKKYIDMLSMLKMNYFHWHLTEGLGWRVEIKKYPELTKTGAFVGKGKEQQGYYTQKEIREIVKYAEKKGITVVPEIDMPGHSEAALFAYPQYSCFGAPIKIPETAFTPNIFCAGKEDALTFLRNVLDEVCDLFPSAYIHLGGDEAPKDNWNKCPDCIKRREELGLKNSHDLQLWFMSQMAEYIQKKGRKAIMWGDVVYEKGHKLPENVVIQWWNWRGHRKLALNNAMEAGHPVICGTNKGTYLNFPLTPWKGYGADRTQSIEDIYTNNPSYIKEQNPLVLGMSCALWTDYELTEDMLDDRLFPRIFAISELMWHNGEELPSFNNLVERITTKKAWFNNQGYMW
ncbi:MAG: beta-N-acetylhexosaminidase [Marinifilaceae bacterium]